MIELSEFSKAADRHSSVSQRDRVSAFYRAAVILSRYSLSWCSGSTPKDENEFDIAHHPTTSEEFRQVLRMRLCVDDIAEILSENSSKCVSELDLTSLVHLMWSLAILGLFETELIQKIQKRIETLPSSPMNLDDSVALMFAEAMLLNGRSSMDLDLSDSVIKSMNIPTMINCLFSYALLGKPHVCTSQIRRMLLHRLSHIPMEASIIPFALRAVTYTAAVIGDDSHHEVNKIKSMYPHLNKLVSRPAWKYSFQLSLACHAAVGGNDDFEINPIVEGNFAFDASLASSRRRKVLIELVRPSNLIREIGTYRVVNADGYTRMARDFLSRKGFRVLAITVGEWAKHNGDMKQQISFVRHRIRSCQNKMRLYSGMERDEEALAYSSDYSDSDSDMSD